MDEYPDPDDEYELMYADELELLRDKEDIGSNVKQKAIQAKRSLDFSSPIANKTPLINNDDNIITVDTEEIPLTGSLTAVEELLPSQNGANNKRSIEDVFGDIGDIDFTEELPSKRQKTEEEIDNELINRILEGKRLRQMIAAPTARAKGQPSYDAMENLSLDIPRWAFVPITNSDGDRIYVKMQSEESWDQCLEETVVAPALLTCSAEMWEEARKILDKRLEEQNGEGQSEMLPNAESVANSVGTELWVDRYKPSCYVDLLSEEPINRSVLHWLHLWDKVVFKREVKITAPRQRSSFSRRTGQFEMGGWRGAAAESELGEDGRPRLRVVLLCGPPGVGKTTLAHLLATLAGYRAVELNASDERSVEAFSTALQSATLMRSVLDAERRPNCLILDEIDGAPLPTVELLVKWCTASSSKSSTDGKKKTKSQPLRRPVIAICNDLYAPSLRPLRPVSLVVRVGGVCLRRLGARLKAVCSREGLRARPHVLAALAARADGDVRAALSVLQFLKARDQNQITMEDVMGASIGQKDCNKGLMQALQAVFTTNDDVDPFATVHRAVMAAGEYDRLAEGIFEHYLTARVDAHLHVACGTLEWLRMYDMVNSWTIRHQNYSLYSMLPICAASCYSLLASRHTGRMKFPTQALEVSRKVTEMRCILDAVCRGTSPSVAPSMRRALHLDVMSLLPYLLAPTVRSGNIQLCSENERKALLSAAAAMCDYGLQYVQQRGADGVFSLVLEPDIHRLAFFGMEERVRVPPTIRQAISREQQLEQIRRLEFQTAKVTNTRTTFKVPEERMVSKETDKQSLPNHLQRLRPKAIERAAPLVYKDFFGRVVPIADTIHRTDAVRDLISSSSVFYQYREGFNNAVRRSVRIRDLM